MIKLKDIENKYIDELLNSGIDDIPSVDSFQARRITKTELARHYHITTDALRKRIKEIPELVKELNSIGYKKSKKEFTKDQVQVILKYLKDPY